MREVFVCSMLLLAGIDDLRRSKISNYIVFPAILISLAYRVYLGGFTYALRGISDMSIVCLLFLPVFKLRGIGAGDIKLFCMITGFYNILFGLRAAALTIVLAGAIALYRVLKNPDLLGRFMELKNYVFYGANGETKYFIAEESEKAETIRIAPFAVISYFLILLMYKM